MTLADRTDGFISKLTRGFFNGGSLCDVLDGLLQLFFSSRHTSRCRLIDIEVKSLKQIGHCTESGDEDVISVAMMVNGPTSCSHVIKQTT